MKKGEPATYNGIQTNRKGQRCMVLSADKDTASVRFDDGLTIRVLGKSLVAA